MTVPIIIALDGLSKAASLSLAKNISNQVWGFKAHDILIREGFDLIQDLKQYGKVFVDLKFYDIPATVEKEVAAIVDHGADLVTVHSSGGAEMLKAAVSAGGNKVVAVTILTSQKDEKGVTQLAQQAYKAGVKNVVCSAHEARAVRALAPDATIITPGIRLENDNVQDQKRVATPRYAIEEGADLLVIGRPITKAPDPDQALQRIITSIS